MHGWQTDGGHGYYSQSSSLDSQCLRDPPQPLKPSAPLSSLGSLGLSTHQGAL